MSDKMLEAKEACGLSYSEICKKAGLSRSTAFKAINSTWRSKLETVLQIGQVIGLDRKKVLNIWKEEKAFKADEKFNTL